MSMKPFPREHGTDRGYQQHRNRRDMPACEPCMAAHRIVSTATKRRSKANAAIRCVECGAPAGYGRRRYCGEECYRLGKNRRAREWERRIRTGEAPRPSAPELVVDIAPRVRWVRRGLVWKAVAA